MKDIIISSQRIKKELLIMSVCFVIAFLINVGSIIAFKTPWYETFTQIGYVVIITFVLYLLILFVRFIILAIRRLLLKKELF